MVLNSLDRYLRTVMVPQSIAPTGVRLRDLKPLQIALYDPETKQTVDVATYAPDKRYEIVYKTANKGADNPMFGDTRDAKLPVRSYPISRVLKAHTFDEANPEGKPFTAYLGYDGISTCKTLEFPCGEDYGLQIQVRGQAVRNTFGRNLSEIIPFNTGCCDDCSLDEKCSKTADSIIDAIKKSSFYVKEYFKVDKVLSCCIEPEPFDKTDYQHFELPVCDTGDAAALARVQAAYPDYDIKRVSYEGVISTYHICIICEVPATEQAAIDTAQAALDAAEAADPQVPATITAAQTAYDAAVAAGETARLAACTPAPFAATTPARVVCDECPCGYTQAPGGEISAAIWICCLDHTDDYSTPAAALAIVQADGGTVGALATEAKFAYLDGSDAVFTIVVPAGTDLETSENRIKELGVTSATCTATSTIPWCVGDKAYAVNATRCVKFKLDDCGDPAAQVTALTAEVTEFLSDNDDVDLTTLAVRASNDCMVEFTVEVQSQCLEDGCDTIGKDGAVFPEIPHFRGFRWDICDCEGWVMADVTNDAGEVIGQCPTAPEDNLDERCQCGIKFEAAMVTNECVPCAHSIHDNVEREPLEIEVTIISQYDEETSGVCPTLEIDWTVVQFGVAPEGHGQYVLRQEVLSRMYENNLYFDPKSQNGNLLQQRVGYEYSVDPCAFYNHISLYHQYTRLGQSWESAAHNGQRELVKIYVDANNPGLLDELKGFFNATVLQHGLTKLL